MLYIYIYTYLFASHFAVCRQAV